MTESPSFSSRSGLDMFASQAAFQGVFVQRLLQLIQQPDLGTFILCCANATVSQPMFQRMLPGLQTLWNELNHTPAKLTGGSDEDGEIYQRLRALGIEQLTVSRVRQVGPWEVQLNPLRALRPLRETGHAADSLYKPFDPEGFHFNKPFMQRECLWEGQLAGRDLALYFNKYPFTEYHTLLVPERRRALPQYLTEEMFDYIWTLAAELATRLPLLGISYNAYGAYASVNHLHFQTFIRTGSLPLLASRWQHSGGNEAYPLPLMVFAERQAAWRYIEELHASNSAYNLLVADGRVYVLPRRRQGTYHHAGWTAGFSWFEVCGSIIVASQDDFAGLDQAAIEAEFAKMIVG